jgi:hypothetical protein
LVTITTYAWEVSILYTTAHFILLRAIKKMKHIPI